MFQEEEYQKIIHEIKNSVCIIGSSLQLIQKQHPDVASFHYWNDVMSDLSNLNHLFSEVATARLCENLNLKPIHTADFLNDIKQRCSSLFHKDISLSLSMADSLSDINIDSVCLSHAILNLLKNAEEAIDSVGFVQIKALQENHHLILSITDNGCGISSDNLSHLFTPLYSSKENGSGLGLAITKQIITSHQGTISCHSVPGEGTTFTIMLPVLQ